MQSKNFSIDEALKFGWTTMCNNLGFFIALLIVTGLISGLLGGMQESAKSSPGMMQSLLWVISVIVNTIISMGMIKISLKFARGEKGSFDDFTSSLGQFFPYFITSLLYSLIVAGGLLLLIVPGIIWGIQFGYFGYLMIDEGTSISESLQRSSIITRGVKSDLFFFYVLQFLINVAGALCLLIGLFATIPLTMVASAYVYKTLSSQTESSDPKAIKVA